MNTQPAIEYDHTVGFLSGPAYRGFNHPVDVGLGRDGLMYVLNRAEIERPSSKRITMCTVDEEYLGQFGSGGHGEDQMMWPVAISLDADGNVYISDEALHRILVFNGLGEFIDGWGVHGGGDGELNGPAGIAFDPDGNLLVADSQNNRVQRFTSDGTYVDSWGREGSGDGEFNLPWGLTTDQEGNSYIADWRNDRIQKFDSDGKHLATWGTSGQDQGQFSRPSGVALDDDGDIYVTDWGNERVQVLGPDGGFVTKFRGNGGTSKWAEDFMECNPHYRRERERAELDPKPKGTVYASLRDEAGADEKLFWGPTSVKIDGQGRIFVADSCRHRIQIFRKRPETLRTAT